MSLLLFSDEWSTGDGVLHILRVGAAILMFVLSRLNLVKDK